MKLVVLSIGAIIAIMVVVAISGERPYYRDTTLANVLKLEGHADDDIKYLLSLPNAPVLTAGRFVDTNWLYVSDDRRVVVVVGVTRNRLQIIDTVANLRGKR